MPECQRVRMAEWPDARWLVVALASDHYSPSVIESFTHSLTRHPPLAICHLLFAICYLPPATRHLLFAICDLLLP